MSVPAPTMPARADAPPAGAVRQALAEELRRAAGPLAEVAGMALAVVGPGGACWVAGHPGCACSQEASDGVACLNGRAVSQRERDVIDATTSGGEAMQVVACCDPASRPLAAALRPLVETCLRHAEGGCETESLRRQLSACNDSLDAFYDIGLQLRAGTDPRQLLRRILNRAAAVKEGLHAVLWLNHDDQLEALTVGREETLKPRNFRDGILGRALLANETLTLTGRAQIAALAADEPELGRATVAAVIPIVSRQGVLGVLEVWREGGDNTADMRALHLLETLAFLVAVVVENDRLHRGARESERLRHDIEIAQRIQQTLLLSQPPVDLHALRAAALSIPSYQIDGDFYDFYAQDQYLDVIIGDVMGKGIPAALVGAATKHHFLRASNHLLASDPGRTPEPREILTIVNEELVKQLVGIESFVTLCFARFDLKKRQLEFIDCGHTRTIHCHGRDGTFALLQGTNMPIGFSTTDVYKQVEVPFGSGDLFFFYSDGITEAKDSNGTYFGETRLAAFVHAHRDLEPKELVEKVRAEVSAFAQADKFADDLTCVAVKTLDVHATQASTQAVLEITSDLAELPRVRGFLRQICQRNFDLDEIAEDMAQLELAMTEAVSNVIVHAFGRQPGRPIRVKADLFVNRLLIRVYHRGLPFDSEKVPPVDLSTPRENSMGLHIIRECMDQVRYFVTEHGENCIHLVKIIKRQPQ